MFGDLIRGRQALVDYKAMLFVELLLEKERIDADLDEKVGLFGSNTRIGQGAQAAGSMVLPGNVSPVIDPKRSIAARIVTPGGGRGLGGVAGRGRRSQPRCPAGYENGGQFSDKNFSNCGRLLFSAFAGIDELFGDVAAAARRAARANDPLRSSAEIVAVEGGPTPADAVQIQRNAQIPRVGGDRQSAARAAIDRLVEAVAPSKNFGTFKGALVRRDGYALASAVDLPTLRTVRNNKDMEDGFLVTSAKNPNVLGEEEAPLLWGGSKMRGVTMAIPGGGRVSLERTGPLGKGGSRRLTRLWEESANLKKEEFDYGARIRKLAADSNGALAYTEQFDNKNSGDLVTVRRGNQTRRVKRWIYDAFLREGAPGLGANKPWKIDGDTPVEEKPTTDARIGSLAQAIRHLDNDGDIDEVPVAMLATAMDRSKTFRKRKLRDGVTQYEASDGRKYLRSRGAQFSHLSQRVSADVHEALGLRAPKVRFLGQGANRDVLIDHPENIGSVDRSRRVASMNPDELLAVAVSDWLLDQRRRSPASLVSVGRGSRGNLIATNNEASALAGLSRDELNARRRAVLGEFYEPATLAMYQGRFDGFTTEEKRGAARTLTQLIQRAKRFKWDDYIRRLSIDGELSPVEQRHLEVVKEIYENRLENLEAARNRFLAILRAR